MTKKQIWEVGGYTSVGGYDLYMDAIEAADQRTVMCPLFSGLFTGNTKYLWLSAMNITVELELADTYANILKVSSGTVGSCGSRAPR